MVTVYLSRAWFCRFSWWTLGGIQLLNAKLKIEFTELANISLSGTLRGDCYFDNKLKVLHLSIMLPLLLVVRIVRFVIEDTIEERILKLQEKKELVFQGLVFFIFWVIKSCFCRSCLLFKLISAFWSCLIGRSDTVRRPSQN